MDTNTSAGFLPACDTLIHMVSDFAEANDDLSFTDNLDRNVSCLEHAPELTKSALLKAVILMVMAVLSLVGNIITIISITKNRRKRQGCSAIYSLILHLSVADLLVTVFCIIGEAIWSYKVEWIWGNLACKIFKFLQMFSLYLSTYILVLIGIDRFIAVRYPMKSLNTAQRCNRLVMVIWILAFILSIPQLIIFRVARGPFIEEFSQCVTHGFYTKAWQEQLYTTLSLVFMFVLPLAILVVTYVYTVITITRSQRVFKSELVTTHSSYTIGDVNRRRLIHRAKTKSLRISVVIVAAFILCWTPYYTMMIIFMFLNPDKHLSEGMQTGIFFFGMSNSLVNPLIYGAFHLWPQKRRQGSNNYRDGSTIHLRSTTTNASFSMGGPRLGSTRIVRQYTTKKSDFEKGEHATDETVLARLMEDPREIDSKINESPLTLNLSYHSSNGDVISSTKSDEKMST